MPLDEVVRPTTGAPKPRPLGNRSLDLSGSVRSGIMAAATAPDAPVLPVQRVAEARAQLSAARLLEPMRQAAPTAEGLSALYDNDPTTQAGPVPTEGRMGAYQQMTEAQPGYTKPDATPREDTARIALDEALRSQRVAALEKSGTPEKKTPIRKQVDRMTAEEYAALTPTQKAAVEFNAMLVGAVRQDRKMGEDYDPTQKQEERYQQSVSEMFGEDGGSEQYAPATMAVLKQIDFQDENADLDDFLGLKAAIRAKDLDDLTPPTTPPAVTVSGESPMSDLKLERVSVSREIAEKTQEMGETLAKGNQLLHNLQASAMVARQDSIQLLGGAQPAQPNAPIGYDAPVFDANGNATDLNSYFQQAFEGLANPSIDSAMVLDDARTILKPEEFGLFMTYAENRSKQAQQYGGRLGTTEGVKYRTPEQFREMLGLDREGR